MSGPSSSSSKMIVVVKVRSLRGYGLHHRFYTPICSENQTMIQRALCWCQGDFTRLQSLQGRIVKRSYSCLWLPAVVEFDRQRSAGYLSDAAMETVIASNVTVVDKQ